MNLKMKVNTEQLVKYTIECSGDSCVDTYRQVRPVTDEFEAYESTLAEIRLAAQYKGWEFDEDGNGKCSGCVYIASELVREGAYRVPQVSTTHISPKSFRWLEAASAEEVLVFKPNDPSGYGLFVYVDPDPDEDVSAYPGDIIVLMQWAAGHDCVFIRLTPDGEEYAALPKYSW